MNFPEKISDQEIERSLWLIKNKALIKKIITISLLVVILGLYGFSLLKFINIKIQDNNETSFNLATMSFQSLQEKYKSEKLIIVNKNIIPLTNNRYDVVVEIKNPNERIAVRELKYKFIYDNQSSEEKTAFLLPNETKKFIDFNIESNKIIRTVDMEIIDISWERLKVSEIEKFDKKIFVIDNQEMHFDNQNNNARNWIEFTASNESPYNWLQTKFYVSLYLGTKLVAVNEIKTEKFYSQEEKNLKASWFQKMPSYVTLEIKAETNLLDPENYIDPQ